MTKWDVFWNSVQNDQCRLVKAKLYTTEITKNLTWEKSFPCEIQWLVRRSWDREFQTQSSHLDRTGYVHQMAWWAGGYHPARSWVIRSTPGQCLHHRQSTTECSVALWQLDVQRTSARRRSIHECLCLSGPTAVATQYAPLFAIVW